MESDATQRTDATARRTSGLAAPRGGWRTAHPDARGAVRRGYSAHVRAVSGRCGHRNIQLTNLLFSIGSEAVADSLDNAK